MWRQIGIKDSPSHKSISQVSNASSDRRYRRRRPYNESDSIDYVQNQFSRMDVLLYFIEYFDQKEKEKQALEEKVSSKKDKELISFLDKKQSIRKTTSLARINTQIPDPMFSSIKINNLIRSGSLKTHQQVQSLTNFFKRKESDSIPRLNESIILQQQGLYEQINRLNAQLKKQKKLNQFLLQKLNQYKIIYQHIDIYVKQNLYEYYQIQKSLFCQVQNIFQKIIENKVQHSFVPQGFSTEDQTGEFYTKHNKQSNKSKVFEHRRTKSTSISLILGVVDQMKNRILQKTMIQVSSPKSSHGGGYSPRSDKKRTVLPSVAQFEELINR